MRKLIVATTAALSLIAVNVLPAAASGHSSTSTVNFSVTGGLLSLVTIPVAPAALPVAPGVQKFSLGAWTATDLRATNASYGISMSSTAVSAVFEGNASEAASVGVQGCIDDGAVTPVTPGDDADLVIAANADCTTDAEASWPDIKTAAATVGTVNNSDLTKVSTATFTPQARVDLTGLDAGVYEFTVTISVA